MAVEARIAELYREGRDELGRPFGAAQVREQLLADFDAADVPDVRTIRRVIKELPPDETGPWRVATADPSEIASVLPVLAHVVRETFGAITEITRQEAALIQRIRAAAPNLPAKHVWHLTKRYILDSEEQQRLYDLFLALAPWESAEARDEYERFVRRSGLAHREQILALILSDSVAGKPGQGIKKEVDNAKRTRQKKGPRVEHRAGRGKGRTRQT